MGIVGVGVMGGYHARVATHLDGCRVVGVYDADHARAEKVAELNGVSAYAQLPALCAAVDAVVIATPTKTHAETAAACLRAGCHVLLEKPLALSLPEAEKLEAVSRQSDRLLMVGHVERYNPAFAVLQTLLNPAELFACELRRMSTAPGRDQSADVIYDLMIHDCDLVLACTQSPVVGVSAMGQRVRGGLIDHVTALVQFANGAVATLTASAVSQERSRMARLFTRTAQFTVDFAAREVFIHRHGRSSYFDDEGQYYLASQMEQILVPQQESLVREHEHFLHCIRTGAVPATNATAALAAVRLADAIQAQVQAQLATPID